ncbi:TPA: transglutaminase family protein [Legionella pneumophila]|nr:transglutaminase domain-containing protein [Legionella pneumophila]
MEKIPILADYQNPMVQKVALELTQTESDIVGKVRRIFEFVRDEIKFGFSPDGDWVSASKTLQIKIGQCNTKSTLFLALCKALNIPARIHFSLIKREIQHGVFPEFLYLLLPKQLSHSWIEINIDNKWLRIDGYIDDLVYFRGAIDQLTKSGWDIGFAIACDEEKLSPEFNPNEEKFEQMCAVTEDHGIWNDPIEYYQSNLYRNRPNFLKQFIYRLFIPLVNHRIEKIRQISKRAGT